MSEPTPKLADYEHVKGLYDEQFAIYCDLSDTLSDAGFTEGSVPERVKLVLDLLSQVSGAGQWALDQTTDRGPEMASRLEHLQRLYDDLSARHRQVSDALSDAGFAFASGTVTERLKRALNALKAPETRPEIDPESDKYDPAAKDVSFAPETPWASDAVATQIEDLTRRLWRLEQMHQGVTEGHNVPEGGQS